MARTVAGSWLNILILLRNSRHTSHSPSPVRIRRDHNRNRVERLWARLKEWRAVATRYEKTACSFMGVLCMAATMDWIK